MTKLAEILTGPEMWCQGHHAKEQRICLSHALTKLHGFRWMAFAELEEWKEYRRLAMICGDPCVSDWNDAPERTWDEVATVVDAYDRDRMLHP